MFRRLVMLLVVFAGLWGTLASFVIPLYARAAPGIPTTACPPPTRPSPAAWPMFKHDAAHTGLADGVGNFSPSGPNLRWKYKMFDVDATNIITNFRWTTTFPLADVDGDGQLEVIATTPDPIAPNTLKVDGVPIPDRVVVLKDQIGQNPPVRAMWFYTVTGSLFPGLDTYSPAVADANGDGLPDVIFATKDGHIRALRGCDGLPLWDYDSHHYIESGPTIADLDGTGLKVVITTSCPLDSNGNCLGDGGSLHVLPITGTGTITRDWGFEYPYKMDSAVPAIAALDPNNPTQKQIIAGSWGGEMIVAWRSITDSTTVLTRTLVLRTLDATIPITETPVIRSSPLVYDWGEGPTAVFGWLATDERVSEARISAIGLRADLSTGNVSFTPRWIRNDYDVWKSSPSLLPRAGLDPLIVAGYGTGNDQPGPSGAPSQCFDGSVVGGIVALTRTGAVEWHHDFNNEGNVRGSPAVGLLGPDDHRDVVLPAGCWGKLHFYDGVTGNEKWTWQLGGRTQNSPSIGDIAGDGRLEVVVGSYDGYVWALGGGPQIFLPWMTR
ncbi:MAG: VCBS repeat-containing protein [Anaerolineae bacterium]